MNLKFGAGFPYQSVHMGFHILRGLLIISSTVIESRVVGEVSGVVVSVTGVVTWSCVAVVVLAGGIMLSSGVSGDLATCSVEGTGFGCEDCLFQAHMISKIRAMNSR